MPTAFGQSLPPGPQQSWGDPWSRQEGACHKTLGFPVWLLGTRGHSAPPL